MINPIGLTLPQWADAVILDNGDAFSFGRLQDESEWQSWARAFCTAQPFAQRAVPDPYQFDDWREWAMRSYTMLEGQG